MTPHPLACPHPHPPNEPSTPPPGVSFAEWHRACGACRAKLTELSARTFGGPNRVTP